MTQPITGYRVQSQRQINNLDSGGTVTPGREITVLDTQTNNTLKVFVPDTEFSAANVQKIIEFHINTEREVHNLGSE